MSSVSKVHQIIAIDGPAGAGKSTVSKEVAKILSFYYLDTGATYRMAAYLLKDLIERKKGPQALLQELILHKLDYNDSQAFIDGKDVTELIRLEQISELASKIAVIGEIRKFLVNLQRSLVNQHGNSVVEGRDVTTVVFPNATLKIFLTADPQHRAQRRAKDLNIANTEVLTMLEKRDQRDLSRSESPLRIAPDAVVIDNTNYSIDETIAIVLELWKQKTQSSK
jgi:cytidylate kinase